MIPRSPESREVSGLAAKMQHLIDDLETHVTAILIDNDQLRAALRTIRAGITEATAYPETVVWLRGVVDKVLCDE